MKKISLFVVAIGIMAVAFYFFILISTVIQSREILRGNLAAQAAANAPVVYTDIQSFPGFATAVNIMSEAGAPIILPQGVDLDPSVSYINVIGAPGPRSYFFVIGATPGCDDKLCTIASFVASPATGPLTPSTADKYHVTSRLVVLDDGTKAYYNDGHAEADWWPATIYWNKGGMSYSIMSDQVDIVWMANHLKKFSYTPGVIGAQLPLAQINNFKETMAMLQQQNAVPVLYPSAILQGNVGPASGYYMDATVDQNPAGYHIYISTGSDSCTANSCMIIGFSAHLGSHSLPKGQSSVVLDNGIKANYSPNMTYLAQLSWVQNGVTYNLSGTGVDRDMLVWMANHLLNSKLTPKQPQ